MSVSAPSLPSTVEAPAAAAPASERGSSLRRFLSLDLLDNRYPSLHGLRVIAIVSVVQLHVTYILSDKHRLPLDPEFVGVSLSIFFGMDLFFVLSGFLIGSILLRSIEVEGSQQLRRFYIRRIFRTFPSYWVMLTLLVLATSMSATQRANLPWEYLYATNWLSLRQGHLTMPWGWSLALEEQFYLTVPLLIFLLQRARSVRSSAWLLGAIWASALLVRFVIIALHPSWSDQDVYYEIYFRSYSRYDALVGGVLLALVHRQWGAAVQAWLQDPFHRALVAMTSMACLWLLLEPAMFGQSSVRIVRAFLFGTVTTIMYFGVVLLLLHTDGPIRRVLSAPAWRRIATLGYGVYLVHIPVTDEIVMPLALRLHKAHVPVPVLWVGSLAGVMVVSLTIGWAMHVAIEKPALKLREWLAA